MHILLYTMPLGLFTMLMTLFTPLKENKIRGDKPTNHLFVYVESVLEDPIVTYGNLVDREGKYIKDSISTSPDYTYAQLKTILSKLPEEKQNILFYTHGLWADKKSFYQTATPILDQNIFEKPDQKYGVIVSLQWHGTINYIKDYDITAKAGKLLAPIYVQMVKTVKEINPNAKVAHLGHSMGHQVLYSMLSSTYDTDQTLTIDQLMFCAADIRDTIIQDPVMHYYVSNSESTSIFHNRNDRTLRMATFAVEGNRLGIYGPKTDDSTQLPPQVEVIDVSNYDDFESRPGQMSLHRYFYDSPKARNEMLEILSR